MRRVRDLRGLLLAAWLLLSGPAQAADGMLTAEVVSRAGLFRVAVESSLDPPVINKIHSWVLHLETADGRAVDEADITVDGGMPAHDHGLPTRPRVTRSLGGGDFLIEGLRFHMNGYWEIVITIRAGDVSDRVVIPLEL